MSSPLDMLKSKLAPYAQMQDLSKNYHDFNRLNHVVFALEKKVDARVVTLIPPEEKRKLAIKRLKSGVELAPSEWKMVFFALNDISDEDLFSSPLIEDADNFSKVTTELENKLAGKRLTRREWLALCSSYFGYSNDEPQKNLQWCRLRDLIARGFEVLKANSPRVMEWTRTVDQYADIFTDAAGQLLGQQFVRGEIADISALEKVAQIPQNSWLWRKIVNHLVNEVFRMDDAEFQPKINQLLALIRQLGRFKDNILAATLTRYCNSALKNQTHLELKQVALEYWGNPQLTSRNKGWEIHVDKPVLLMVQGWFAKDDLKLFFELLKGNRDVDHARLFYWLRYANQMSYTRIVIGGDTQLSKDQDYVEFRHKNKGRLSKLSGPGSKDNNAMIMRIGDYLFVEFSKVGAMYTYHITNAPFNPETGVLDIDYDLKDKRNNRRKVVLRLAHNSPASNYSLKNIPGWMRYFDEDLKRLGIYYVSEESSANMNTARDMSRFEARGVSDSNPVVCKSPASQSMPRTAISESSIKAKQVQDEVQDREEQIRIIANSLKARKEREEPSIREQQIRAVIKSVDCNVVDKRGLGGAIHIQFNEPDHEAARKLLSLGFKPIQGKLTYWSK